MNKTILLIETSTECCSVAITQDCQILASQFTTAPKQHAGMLIPFINEIMEKSGCPISSIDAVAVSSGPGSYTGLRVGVSAAKGICFGASIPLISVPTTDILAYQGKGKADFIIPMIDARRMEVYSALYDGMTLRRESEIEADILDENSHNDTLKRGKVLFIGDNVKKFQEICKDKNALFETAFPLAEAMAEEATRRFDEKQFEDVAYFEPFYLKEFVPGISKKKLF